MEKETSEIRGILLALLKHKKKKHCKNEIHLNLEFKLDHGDIIYGTKMRYND